MAPEEIKKVFDEIFSKEESRVYFFKLLEDWQTEFARKFNAHGEKWLKEQKRVTKKYYIPGLKFTP